MPGIGRSLALPKSFAPRRTDEEFNERRVDRFVYRQPKTIEDFIMEFRQLGGSGLKVPALCLGTGTFGGKNEFFRGWGATEVEEALL
jgi:hypothetical protein